jgi:hypothetical protein
MAATFNAAQVYTLSELKQFYEDDGKLSALVNALIKDDPIMEDIPWKMGNQTDGHKHKIVTKMPKPQFRRLYGGTKRTKSGVASVRETTRQISDRWEIDVDELKMYEGSDAQNAFRMQEGERHIEGMQMFCTDQLFYGNPEADVDQLRGLSARYPYKDAPNVIDGGGSAGDQTSVWAVVWGANEVFGFYPKNMKAGIEHTDLNNGTPYDAYDENGDPFQVVGDEWKWNLGFAVADWRCAARLCNITVANLSITDPDDASYIDLGNLTIDLKNAIPRKKRKRIRFYVSNAVMSALEKQARKDSNVYLRYGEWQDSSEILKMHGCPVFECDSLLENEAVLGAMP